MVKNTQGIENQIKRKLAEVAPKDPKARRQWLEDINKKGVAPKPPKQRFSSGANIDNLPEKVKDVIVRADHDEEYLSYIKEIIETAALKLIEGSKNQETFCDYFRFPQKIDEKLFKIYGVSYNDLKREMQVMNFNEKNRGMSSPYIIAVSLAYAIGLYKNDEVLKRMSLLLILAFQWNKSIKAHFKVACNPNIARYVTQYMTKKNSEYIKNGGTPFNVIYQYYLINFYQKLDRYIRQDVAHPSTGLIKIATDAYAKLQAMVNRLARKYYEAHENGWEEVISDSHSSAYNNGEMVESRETFRNIIGQLLDKFNKNQMISSDIIMQRDVKEAIFRKFGISDKLFKMLNDYFNDDENHEDLSLGFEFLLNGLKPKDDEELCSINMASLLTVIGNAKKNEFYTKLKEFRGQIMEHVFDSKNQKYGTVTLARLNQLSLYALLLYYKKLTCNKI